MKLISKIILFSGVILLLYATTLTDPHTLVFWTAFMQSEAFFWALIAALAVVGLLIVIQFWQSHRFKRKRQEAEALLAQAQKQAASQSETLSTLKQELEDRYQQKETALQAEYDALKEPYVKKINELKEKNIALKDTVSKLMQALKAKKADR